MMAEDVTIVVATYNRAEVLRRTLRCARAQTHENWRMIVVGDACSDGTEAMVSALGDDRIRFINLPQRFGEQSGPNSVGMALADGQAVAFLNHDDYWLPNHLEEGVRALRENEADLYWSRAAFFTNRGPRVDRAIFTEESPASRSLSVAVHAPPHYSEPMSSWVVRRETLERVGAMTAASRTHLMPIQDYCIRLWRAGTRLYAGRRITVLKDRVVPPAPERGTKIYGLSADFAESWVDQVERGDTSHLLASMADDLWLSRALGLARAFEPTQTSGNTPAEILAASGLDLMALRADAAAGESKLLSQTLARRTGEHLDRQPELAEMIAFAKARVSK